MSYCRWSSDDFQCDVYTYEDCMGGWTTHVASRRRIFKEPLPPEVDYYDREAGMKRYKKVMEMVEEAEVVDIGLPEDGETFNDDTPGECANTLETLKNMGYRVPQYAIDALRAEGTDTQGGGE